ncbi:hypothetical protein JCM19037_4806 [Geomicrobium sp. JCM 19037]|uniref:alkaline shock response membrane anchor protein AmaP n=1 Tax=unclassified Geomicrobium TaxID=2628951 RepID=UPI00045F15EC|nr:MULTISPECIES: alkaline shock response membrane anchor protein AmaP [unclassified Geomicrobium]GAK06226.1 hypothetical protein JCM19037_4806 [Geomicrobium sp. JCM 19037]GAK12130.1 hypothetical protein JCM19039_1870 [Geomicrobium sp. JCM 19039]
MNRFTQFIIGLNSFLTLLLITAFVLLAFNVYDIFLQIEMWPNSEQWFWVLIGILAFMALVSFILFVASFRTGESSSPRSRGNLDVRTPTGTLSISKQTIDSTIYRIVKSFEGIRTVQVKSFIDSEEEKIDIEISYAVFGKEPVQQMADRIQRTVKEDVEQFLEVAVDNIKVNVKEPDSDQTQRERVV